MKVTRKQIQKLYALLILFVFIISCSPNEKEIEFEPQYLISYEEMVSISREDILASLSGTNMLPEEFAFLIQYGVTGLKIVYETVGIDGEKIAASGALLVPTNLNPMPLISFQHGTITSESDAPSNFNSNSNMLASSFAASGYIIVMPDYIGYGSSKQLPHPYEHRATLATSTRDMLRASLEYFKVIGVSQPNSKLFFTGYSEGGSATMATLKLIQEEHSAEFDITAATLGAGAYNKTVFMDWIVNSDEELEYINSFVWVLDVYNSIYPQLQRNYSFYFNEPWATSISNNGVFEYIEPNPKILFKSSFIEGVLNRTDTDFITSIADNDCFNWRPDFPLKLYHGTADNYVPYINSLTAFNAMIENGANGVELITIEEGTHSTSLSEYAAGTFAFFFQLLLN
jgi:pimeloyl-ACP methyl ester carboxylesterase